VTETWYSGGVLSSSAVVIWDYDAQGRLIQEDRLAHDASNNVLAAESYVKTYGYDLAGNRRTYSVDEGNDSSVDETVTSTFDENDRLTDEDSTDAAHDATYTYDDNGGTLSHTLTDSGATQRYVWDLRGRMVGFDANGDNDTADVGDFTYAYDSQGVRVKMVEKVADGPDAGTDADDQPTYFLQDLSNPTGYSQVLEESGTRTPTDPPDRSFAVGAHVIAQADGITAADGSTVRHLLYDAGGSTRSLLDATGQPVTDQIYAYDAFGSRIEDPQNPIVVATPLLYRGEYFDAALGQYQLRARYYDPAAGRFFSRDPRTAGVGDLANANLYLYGAGDPIGNMDPSGNRSLTELLGGMSLAAKLMAGAWGLVGLTNLVRTGVAVKHPVAPDAAEGTGRWYMTNAGFAASAVAGGAFATTVAHGESSGIELAGLSVGVSVSLPGLAKLKPIQGTRQWFRDFNDGLHSVADLVRIAAKEAAAASRQPDAYMIQYFLQRLHMLVYAVGGTITKNGSLGIFFGGGMTLNAAEAGDVCGLSVGGSGSLSGRGGTVSIGGYAEGYRSFSVNKKAWNEHGAWSWGVGGQVSAGSASSWDAQIALSLFIPVNMPAWDFSDDI
jgi:RHS repeat-associated protein